MSCVILVVWPKSCGSLYHGRERNRQFEIYVNEVLLSAVKMEGDGADTWADTDYALPESWLSNPPSTFIVKFVAKEGSATANIFEVRLLK